MVCGSRLGHKTGTCLLPIGWLGSLGSWSNRPKSAHFHLREAPVAVEANRIASLGDRSGPRLVCNKLNSSVAFPKRPNEIKNISLLSSIPEYSVILQTFSSSIWKDARFPLSHQGVEAGLCPILLISSAKHCDTAAVANQKGHTCLAVGLSRVDVFLQQLDTSYSPAGKLTRTRPARPSQSEWHRGERSSG